MRSAPPHETKKKTVLQHLLKNAQSSIMFGALANGNNQHRKPKKGNKEVTKGASHSLKNILSSLSLVVESLGKRYARRSFTKYGVFDAFISITILPFLSPFQPIT